MASRLQTHHFLERPYRVARRALCTAILAMSTLIASMASAQVKSTLLKPARVFDGTRVHEAWGVLVEGDRIVAVGPLAELERQNVTAIDLPGATLLPGLI